MKAFFISIATLLISLLCHSQGCNELYLMRQSVFPNHSSAFWFPDHREIQGITNDGQNWFLTTTRFVSQFSGEQDNGYLWKIPLSVPLNASSPGNGVLSVAMTDIPALNSGDYMHFGDCDYYVHNGVGYIIVPTYDTNNSGNGVIACFRASDLTFINYGNIPQRPGWCAIDQNGYLYTSGSPTQLRRYNVAWDELTASNGAQNSISGSTNIPINFSSSDFDQIYNYQGGEFDEDNNYLYLSSGAAGGCLPWPGGGCGWLTNQVGPDGPRPSDGLHVIRTSDWKILETSVNSNSNNHHFIFNFDAGISGEQPQGLTYWDLDDNPAAGNNKGKIHVMMFDFDFGLGTGDHEFSLFHFSDRVHVDHNSTLISPFVPGVGGHELPFPSFNEAFDHYPIWNGSTIVLKAGNYNETGVYNKCVKLTSDGGAATIGN